jgi:hypothetical protein
MQHWIDTVLNWTRCETAHHMTVMKYEAFLRSARELVTYASNVYRQRLRNKDFAPDSQEDIYFRLCLSRVDELSAQDVQPATWLNLMAHRFIGNPTVPGLHDSASSSLMPIHERVEYMLGICQDLRDDQLHFVRLFHDLRVWVVRLLGIVYAAPSLSTWDEAIDRMGSIAEDWRARWSWQLVPSHNPRLRDSSDLEELNKSLTRRRIT